IGSSRAARAAHASGVGHAAHAPRRRAATAARARRIRAAHALPAGARRSARAASARAGLSSAVAAGGLRLALAADADLTWSARLAAQAAVRRVLHQVDTGAVAGRASVHAFAFAVHARGERVARKGTHPTVHAVRRQAHAARATLLEPWVARGGALTVRAYASRRAPHAALTTVPRIGSQVGAPGGAGRVPRETLANPADAALSRVTGVAARPTVREARRGIDALAAIELVGTTPIGSVRISAATAEESEPQREEGSTERA